MTRFLQVPGLPSAPVSHALLSGEYPQLVSALKRWVPTVWETKRERRLDGPVSSHGDMQICHLGGEKIIALQGTTNSCFLEWEKLGGEVQETEQVPQSMYPGDVLCNCSVIGRYLVGNIAALDAAVLRLAAIKGLQPISVKQGYAGCSICKINETAVITADRGIAEALQALGLEVLLISPGHISLPGYDTGFIGGCCGLIAPDKLVSTGDLKRHPQGQEMLDFIRHKNVTVLSLAKEPLLDIGGILPLLEEVPG